MRNAYESPARPLGGGRNSSGEDRSERRGPRLGPSHVHRCMVCRAP